MKGDRNIGNVSYAIFHMQKKDGVKNKRKGKRQCYNSDMTTKQKSYLFYLLN